MAVNENNRHEQPGDYRSRPRWSAGKKVDAVLRLLHGEPLDALSRELGLEAHRLEAWRDDFMEGGKEALKGPDRSGDDGAWRWFFLRRSPPRRRLLAAIIAYRYERYVANHHAPDTEAGTPKVGSNPGHPAEELLDKAERAVNRADLDTGYACFLAAQRVDILGFNEFRLHAAATSLWKEAQSDKIKEWRRDAILDVLKDVVGGQGTAAGYERMLQSQEAKGTKPKERRRGAILGLLNNVVGGKKKAAADKRQRLERNIARLQEATLLRDEDAQNTYRKLNALKRQLLVLGTVLFGALVVLSFMVRWFPLSDKLTEPFAWSSLGFVALFGLLGASMSAILSVTRRGTRANIPEQLLRGAIVFGRPLFGAVAALALYFFVRSGLFTAGPVTIDKDSTAAILGLAFIAGFSERLVVYAVETTAKKESDDAPGGTRAPVP